MFMISQKSEYLYQVVFLHVDILDSEESSSLNTGGKEASISRKHFTDNVKCIVYIEIMSVLSLLFWESM